MKESAVKGPGRTAAPAGEHILVNVTAVDALSRAGLVAQLRPHPEGRGLDEVDSAEAAVLVLVADTVDKNPVRAQHTVHSPSTDGAEEPEHDQQL